MWDSIVIGSGIGGLAAAAALARRGQCVLVLEQHHTPGGQTQTFRRGDWIFDTGVHYLGGVGPQPGPEGQFGRLLDWLAGGALSFAPCANPYDIVRLPGFEFGIEHPESAYRAALSERFPHERAAIDAWFADCEAARKGAQTLFALHAMPGWMAFGLRLLRGAEVERWSGRTLADELARVGDARLRAVLGARWGDHGGPPAQAPFLEHALVTGAYNGGAYYPVGGPATLAQALRAPIEAAGGEVRTGADVRRILVRHGRAAGVELTHDGQPQTEQASHLVSAMGAANTVACLAEGVAEGWRRRIGALGAGVGFVVLYLGLEGDIAAAGAGSANHWIYGSDDVGRLWGEPTREDAPALFVSFPSCKDPTGASAPTAEVLATLDPSAFAPWMGRPHGTHGADYQALKAAVAARLRAQFERHFPALAPMVRLQELATPLTQQHFTRTLGGSMYGLAMTGERLTSPALQVRTPLPGLMLAGQDVFGPGVPAAFMSGLMAAAAIDPALWSEFRR